MGDVAPGSTVSKLTWHEIALSKLKNKPDNFIGGKTRLHFNKWSEMTSDKGILESVTGVCIDFEEKVDQERLPTMLTFREDEKEKMQLQIDKMIEKGIVELAEHEPGEFVSNVFCRPKKTVLCALSSI